MSFKSAEQFVSVMKSTDDLRKSIFNVKSSEEFQDLIKSNGFDFSDYDLARAMSSCMDEMDKNACFCGDGRLPMTTEKIEESTKTLIAIGAATTANCIPCVEHYLSIAESLKVDKDHIQEAVDIASRVKTGASIAINNSIEDISQGKKRPKEAECCKPGSCGC